MNINIIIPNIITIVINAKITTYFWPNQMESIHCSQSTMFLYYLKTAMLHIEQKIHSISSMFDFKLLLDEFKLCQINSAEYAIVAHEISVDETMQYVRDGFVYIIRNLPEHYDQSVHALSSYVAELHTDIEQLYDLSVAVYTTYIDDNSDHNNGVNINNNVVNTYNTDVKRIYQRYIRVYQPLIRLFKIFTSKSRTLRIFIANIKLFKNLMCSLLVYSDINNNPITENILYIDRNIYDINEHINHIIIYKYIDYTLIITQYEKITYGW